MTVAPSAGLLILVVCYGAASLCTRVCTSIYSDASSRYIWELSKRKTVVGPTLGGKRRVYRPFVVDVGMHGQILLLVGD